ncbi:MAG: acyl-[ACP]--phospholipid O-acyltransferase [Endomicrobia bacterium]|nr:acyl-[ACP]--phospholipid O-acyltransferase [Endomicrobiia bacterium]MCL2506177.1 acyl-[ACP]--phospholipid O-acyltransferase [Endomicrobiia bacterium]
MKSFIKILFKRSFLSYYAAQYLGAFTDNLFRAAMAVFVMYEITTISAGSKSFIILLAICFFMLPFFLFSYIAGEIADKYRKDLIIKILKFAELFIIALVILGFYLKSPSLLLFVLFLMGTLAAFFAPVKYSILPDIVKEDELLAGNGLVEAGNYGAILHGALLGGAIIVGAGLERVSLWIGCAALAGFAASLLIPKIKAASPTLKINKNIPAAIWKSIGFVKRRREIYFCILGLSWFWLLGAVIVVQLPSFTSGVLNGDASVFAYLLTLFVSGIALGSVACQFLLQGKVSSKFAPLSILLITVFLVDLALVSSGFAASVTAVNYKTFISGWSGLRVSIDFFFLGLLGGLYVVPLKALLQMLAGHKLRSRIIATNNILNALFLVIGNGVCMGLLAIGFGLSAVFVLLAIFNTIVAVYTLWLLPDHIVRMIVKRIFNVVYGVKVTGLENLENAKGSMIIIANHSSFLDAALLWTYLPGKFYFTVNTAVTQIWWVKLFLHLAKYFPIDPTNPMAVKSIIDEVRNGKRVVIFPEGRITTTGALMKIYPGPTMIADKSNALILPVCIDGSQYSIFSRFGTKFKTRPHSKITINIMPVTRLNLPANLHGRDRRRASARKLYDIMTEMKYTVSSINESLVDSLLDAQALVGRNKEIIEDMNMKPLSFGKLLTACFALGKQFSKYNKQREYAGFLLPNSIAAVAAFFGLRVFNITPCMLNFTMGAKSLLSCCRAAQIKNVYTSRQFIEKAELADTIGAMEAAGIKIIYLEDIKQQISFKDKMTALAASYFPRIYYKMVRGDVAPSAPAVVLFTSGSEGMPKGVVLSHKNIQVNRCQVQTCFDFGVEDIVFNAMPMFHAFGLTGGVMLPLLVGAKTFLYPSPLHYHIVPELIYDRNATVIFGTDTFLNGYAKNAHPYDFYSVRIAVAGAEKLKDETYRTFTDTFGVRVFEAYGATEASPGIAINSPMYFRRGTVGRLLPGVEAKLESVPGLEEGKKLFIKGKNIMLGYIKEDNPGVIQAPPDGWYDTGDIVDIDDDGFVIIKGRAKRFSKIAGEMVSLGAVETALNKLWPQEMHAVIAIPDEKRGEQLVLFTTRATAKVNEIQKSFKEEGLSDLSVPKTIKTLEEIPLMATGKTDYVKLSQFLEQQ